jgi:hypothetical protein
LLKRRNRLENNQYEYLQFVMAVGSDIGMASGGLQDGEISIHLSELLTGINQSQNELDIFRIQVQSKFPLIAALSSDEDFKRGELEDLAKGKEGRSYEAAKVISDQIEEKLNNISDVRDELKPGGDVNVWLLPGIVDSAKTELGAIPGSLYGRFTLEKIKDEQPSAITGILIGILQLGLVLLAPATGGLSLIPAAGWWPQEALPFVCYVNSAHWQKLLAVGLPVPLRLVYLSKETRRFEQAAQDTGTRDVREVNGKNLSRPLRVGEGRCKKSRFNWWPTAIK